MRPIRSNDAKQSRLNRVPRFLHLLTAIHAVGAVACFAMAFGSGISKSFRNALAVSGGSEIMVNIFGPLTWVFLALVGGVLAILAFASGRKRPWAWHLTLVVYGIGVLGSLWQVSVGIGEAWVAVVVNGGVVAYAARPSVREAYRHGNSLSLRLAEKPSL